MYVYRAINDAPSSASLIPQLIFGALLYWRDCLTELCPSHDKIHALMLLRWFGTHTFWFRRHIELDLLLLGVHELFDDRHLGRAGTRRWLVLQFGFDTTLSTIE